MVDGSGATSPNWIPNSAEAYLIHVYHGVPIREIARNRGCHASTVLRQVRKVESSRDDPLTDEAIERLSETYFSADVDTKFKTELDMKNAPARRNTVDEDANIEREARRILRRLCESRAFLLVSPELENAAVFRESVPGKRTRTAVVEREVAQAFVLNEWIEGKQAGKVGIYSITTAGKAALKRLLHEQRSGRQMAAGMNENVTPFQAQHQVQGERNVVEDGRSRKIRCNLAESPLTILARKKGPNGATYITPAMLDAGERLREDFEIAQMGPRVTQNWDNFLTASSHGQFKGGGSDGPSAARDRVGAALKAMGPGLADIAFRSCCFLEGLEVAEKRLGWSARAGKVVLRIALSRLIEHYADTGDNRMIGEKIHG